MENVNRSMEFLLTDSTSEWLQYQNCYSIQLTRTSERRLTSTAAVCNPASQDTMPTSTSATMVAPPPGHPDSPTLLDNQGVTFRRNFERTGDLAHIPGATVAHQKAQDELIPAQRNSKVMAMDIPRLVQAAAALSNVLNNKGIRHAFHGSVLPALLAKRPYSDVSVILVRMTKPLLIFNLYT